MFDIGFSELMVVAVVALIVIGPERLPRVARTLGHLFGRMQRYVNDVKSDISREMELDELKKLQATMQDAARSFEDSVSREVRSAESEIQKIAQEANPTEPPPSASELSAAPGAIEPAPKVTDAAPSEIVSAPGETGSPGSEPAPRTS